MHKYLLALSAIALLCCGAFGQSSGLPDANAVHIVGGNADKAFNLSDGTTPASTQYVDNAVASAVGSGGGGTTTGGGGGTQTFLFNGLLSTTSASWSKMCFIGSSQCSGGVGSVPPQGTPTKAFGLNTPSASTGTANAVEHFAFVNPNPPPNYTQVLWTGNASTSSGKSLYFVHDFWLKAVVAPGKTNLEFDTYLSTGGWLFMFGTQCSGANGYIIQYDNEGNGWVNTSVHCSQLIDGAYHHIVTTYHRDALTSTSCSGKPCEHWDTIQIDTGAVNQLNVTLPATTTTWGEVLDAQFQLDGDPTSASSGSPALYDAYIDTDRLTASATSPGTSANENVGDLGEFDFDAGGTTGLTATGTPTLDAINYYTAPNAAHFTVASQYYTAPFASTNVLYGRMKMQLNTASTANVRVIDIYGGTVELWSLFIQGSNGFLTANNVATTTSTACAVAAYPTGSYHLVEFTWTKGTTTGGFTVSIDGTTLCTVTGINTASVGATSVRFGQVNAPATAANLDIDNVGFSAIGPLGDVSITPNQGGSGGGSGGALDLQTGGAENAAQAALNFVSSSVNAAGLLITPSNTGANEVFEVAVATEAVTFSATPTFSTATLTSYMLLTGNVTSFTLASGVEGQSKILAFCQNGTGGRTVTAPSNVHGFMTVSTTANTCSVGRYTYFTGPAAWLADSAPVVNQ